jgi:hypothetical protein
LQSIAQGRYATVSLSVRSKNEEVELTKRYIEVKSLRIADLVHRSRLERIDDEIEQELGLQ